ncbi:MAG: UDP-3-O-(3-hydroxymyristoyl)glucosamine N-acyltransferase [Porphyromonas sp.]|nr:UDP-3-O-(3-hydroxymyristoyl)glucosamine N-acyltransferase [Porphyromonas sp.]
MKFTAQEIARHLGGTVEGNPDVVLSDFSSIEKGYEGTLSFLSNMQYESFLYSTKSSAVLVNADFEPTQEVQTTLIRVPNAYTALADLLKLRNDSEERPVGVSPLAFVDPTVQIGKECYIGPFSYIGRDTVIGDGVRIWPNTFVGGRVAIGARTCIYSMAVICDHTEIGERCVIHSGAVIGGDGFGFAPDAEGYHKIPQTGRVILQDDVEIGANACVDRAVMDATIIYKGVKIDNLVQIAHNCEVHEHTAIAAQSGVAGSTTIGPWNVLAGQVGVAGHLKTASHVTLAAQTGVVGNINQPNTVWFGSPAQPHLKAMKASAKFIKLPEMDRELYLLRKEVEALKAELNSLKEKRDDK